MSDKQRTFDISEMKNSAAFFQTLFALFKRSQEFCVPAIIKEYDRTTHIAKVIPLPNYKPDMLDENEDIQRDPVSVPVMNICRGGFVISIPIFEGDTGWLIAGDRSTGSIRAKNNRALKEKMSPADFGQQSATKNFGPGSVDDLGVGKFKYGFFIPDSWAKKNDEIVDDDNLLTIASFDSKVKIKIGGEKMIDINGMTPQRMSLLTDVRFNEDTHDLIKEFTEVDGIVNVGDKSEKNVFTATPLSAELPEPEPEPEPETEPEES